MRIALTGNPNSGKTTMYNALTGRNEKVGNWAGVTVEKKEHPIKKAYYSGTEELIAVDLPVLIPCRLLRQRRASPVLMCGMSTPTPSSTLWTPQTSAAACFSPRSCWNWAFPLWSPEQERHQRKKADHH